MTDQETATELAIAYLRAQGYSVAPPQRLGMLRPFEVAKLVNPKLNGNALWRRLHHINCPPFEKIEGEKGKIVWMRRNPDIDAWLGRPLQKGVKTRLVPA